MREVKTRLARVREDERGYTFQEVLTAVAILGVLLAIAIFIFLALLERWRVEAAADQLAADMRLAHTRATSRLTTWRVVLAPGRASEDAGPDYYLVELNRDYDPDARSAPTVVGSTPRVMPADVQVREHRSATSNDDQGEPRWVSPGTPAPEPTRTAEFNPDGTMAFFEGPANSACVTVDKSPMLRVKATRPATSNVEIEDGDGSPCTLP